ncbi:MAG TPA: hypothetical protein VJ866_22985 [Pyrinomonadaceae bacterium]|nr:hypothetical protein [Pyrinomonadaceae bacterium]
MLKPDLLKTAALLLALALGAQGAWAQSGRKGAKSPSPVPSDTAPQGESESGPKKDTPKRPDALVSFVAMRGTEDALTIIDPMARDGVADQFVRRLGQSQAVSVTNAGTGGRADARKRAKDETTAYVVFFQLEEENYAATSGGRVDSRTLVIRTLVYAPKTGDIKFIDTVYQRPYRQTARVKGIPVPVPAGGIERYPSQHELEQAARDAADRILGRFQITPTDN